MTYQTQEDADIVEVTEQLHCEKLNVEQLPNADVNQPTFIHEIVENTIVNSVFHSIDKYGDDFPDDSSDDSFDILNREIFKNFESRVKTRSRKVIKPNEVLKNIAEKTLIPSKQSIPPVISTANNKKKKKKADNQYEVLFFKFLLLLLLLLLT
jgi:hypothetical protein